MTGKVATSAGVTRGDDAGFTLIEVVIALALMALIAVAGVSLLQGMLAARGAAEGRLERTAQLQRAMFLLTDDFEQIAEGPLMIDSDGVAFRRHPAPPEKGRLQLRYRFGGGALVRQVGPMSQTLLDGVESVTWRFYTAEGGWAPTWPPSEATAAQWPAALSLEILLTPGPGRPGGTLRRVVELPDRPRP